jgi:hypothetical protein
MVLKARGFLKGDRELRWLVVTAGARGAAAGDVEMEASTQSPPSSRMPSERPAAAKPFI